MKKAFLYLLLLISTLARAQTVSIVGILVSSGPTVNITPSSVTVPSTVAGTPSAETYIDVSGSNLSTSLSVVMPTADLECTKTSGSGYTGTCTVSLVGANAPLTRVYIRFSAAATAQSYSNFLSAQSTPATPAVSAVSGTVSGATVFRRFIWDIGGNGSFQGGVKTPNNSAGATGQDLEGKYINNKLGFGTAQTFTGVDTAGNSLAGFSISIDKKLGGTFAANDSSLNSAVNATAAVGDYDVTLTQDGAYIHTTSGVVTWTVHLAAGLKCKVKFWGTRAATGPRILEIKKGTDGSYTLNYNASAASGTAGNTSYTGATVVDLHDGDTINMQVQAGSTFGSVSVIDVLVQNGSMNWIMLLVFLGYLFQSIFKKKNEKSAFIPTV